MTLTTRAPAAAPAPGRRTGFTLIELLVVIAIIAVLITIIGVALQKTVEGRKNNTTKEAMYKLQQSLDTEYGRVVAKCNTDAGNGGIPREVLDYADGSPDRARSIWIALHLRRQFPENFKEAVTPQVLTVLGTNGGQVIVFTLQPLETFKEFQVNLGTAAAPNFDANVQGTGATPVSDESAALLYYILAKKSVTGGGAMASSADDLSQSMQRKVTLAGKNGGANRDLPTFADAWTGSIGFRRWYGSGSGDLPEVQAPPYLDSKNQTVNNNKDPIDSKDLVAGWNLSTGDPRIAMRSTLMFNRLNRLTTVYSLGKFPLDPSDDIMGFRQKKFGN